MKLETIKIHTLNVLLVTVGYVIAMILVKEVIVPAQQTYLPSVTVFAALIFPLHGVRVIAAWLFGAWSVVYLFAANFFMHFILTPDADLTTKSILAWFLVSSVAFVTFETLRLAGVNLYAANRPTTLATWRHLLIVGFISSVLNSVGHNIIFASNILPQDSIPIMAAFLIGDTTGTLVCFGALMLMFRGLRSLQR
ncbi:hypothetical protein LSUCC0387_03525 [Rhodobacterales bacterium LSUCC0387]|nr:hypothetical protein [Rhodobacterales bacterium LSUCC0387]